MQARGLVLGGLPGPAGGLDLDLAPGSLVVLTGDAGCGASTLLRVLAGLEDPVAGSVTGGPAVLLDEPPGTEWAASDVVVSALGAPHLLGRQMHQMSRGERQRVRLAGVLADPAPVLLLDEPTGALDLRGVVEVLAALRAAASAGRAVLAVCKSEERAPQVADRVLVLEAGRLR